MRARPHSSAGLNVLALVPVLALLALCGCGATSPQAPLAQAKKLDSALGGISTACGLSYQTTDFARPGSANLSSLQKTASAHARKLASVYARDPGWIYQGQTVKNIVDESISMLGSCGLPQAQKVLRDQVRSSRPRA